MFLSVKQVFNAVHVVSLPCFVCAEEDFLNATDEGADGNGAQGRDLITASSSSCWAKRCCVFLSVQICAPWSTDYANYYQCLWDCTADEADELDFQRGDLVYIISKVCKKHPRNNILFFFLYIFPVGITLS